MYGNLIRGDLRRSRLSSIVILLFVAFASLLLALAGQTAVRLAGAVEGLMERARTPHLLQMHAGPVDEARLAAFALGRPELESWQAPEFLNIEGAAIVLGGRSLAGSVQDNGLAVQGRDFDLLLDLEDRPIVPRPGELYVPLAYLKDGSAKAGERASILGRDFTIAGFLRDSQMNSALSSSKRFLVHEDDYRALHDRGRIERLIEFRLRDPAMIDAFEAAYVQAGLEANGPRLTRPLFVLINSFSDGILIAILVLVGVLVTLVALLCVRFALLAKLEEDWREIGVMKAIGLRTADIRKLYLAVYALLGLSGSLLGFLASLAAQAPLSANLRLYMGGVAPTGPAAAAGLLCAAVPSLFVLAYASRLAGKVRRLPAAEALRSRSPGGPARPPRAPRLADGAALGANAVLGLKALLARPGLYATMLLVIASATFIAILPRRLHATIADPGFSAYLGVGACDLRIDLQGEEEAGGAAAPILEALRADSRVDALVYLEARSFMVRARDGSARNLKVELGDHRSFPVAYASGGPPSSAGEIALSFMAADALGVGLGDGLEIEVDGELRKLAVAGLYSDVTNGGKTAKAAFPGGGAPAMWRSISIRLKDPGATRAAAADYAARHPSGKVSSVADFVSQTFGPTLGAVDGAARISLATAASLCALIGYLFARLLVAKDRAALAAMRALGFRRSDFTRQYLWQAGVVSLLGLGLGLGLATPLGEPLAGAAISAFGASGFKLLADPGAGLLVAGALGAVSLGATALGARSAGAIDIARTIRE